MKSRDDVRSSLVSLLVAAQWLASSDALVLCALPFLTPTGVLILADGVDRHTRRAMASSHAEVWCALVKSAFPKAPFSPCKAPSPKSKTPSALPDSTRLATSKDIFRLMALQESSLLFLGGDASGSGQQQAQAASRLELIPVQLDPEQQRLRVKLGGSGKLHLDVPLTSKNCKDGWVQLRECVQITRLQPRETAPVTTPSSTADRFRTMRHKLSTMNFGKEKDLPALAESSRESYRLSGTVVLTGSHILVQSSVFPDLVARIGDVRVVYTADASSSFTLETSTVGFLITYKTSESAAAWVAAIANLMLRGSVSGDAPPLQSFVAPAAANLPREKLDSRGRLSAKWRATQLPRIRSITCPGSSSTNSSLFSRPLKATKSSPMLDTMTRSSGGSFASAFVKANRLFKSLSFTESTSSSHFVHSAPAFLQQPRLASTRRAFPRPPKASNGRNSAGVLALVKPRRSKVSKRASLTSSSPNGNSSTTPEGQQQKILKLLEEHHHDNNNRSIVGFASGLDGLNEDAHRVCQAIFSLLQSAESFEGHVASRFFERQQQQFLVDSTCPPTCRSYLNKVRDCIQDLVQFIFTFRVKQLQICLKSDQETESDVDDTVTTCENNIKHVKHTSVHVQVPQELGSHVQDAVEAYFFSNTSRFSSLSTRVTKWCSVVATVPCAATFERKLVQWSTLPVDCDEFALSNPHHVENSPSVKRAINSLRAMSDEVAPSRKLKRFMDAVRALNDHTTLESPVACGASGNAVCDADELLPLLIFALCRSRVPTPLMHCVAMQQLCAFSSPHGERVYYLTMFETALEFVRTHTREN